MLDKILKYLGIVWSVVAAIAVAVFFFGGQWEQWKTIREAHKAGNVVNVATPDMSGFAKVNDIPDVSGFALKTDIQEPVDTNVFVKYGDTIEIKSKQTTRSLFDNSGSVGNQVIVTSPGTKWTIGKSN